MKIKSLLLSIVLLVIGASAMFESCAPGKAIIAQKTGAVLWTENCMRCHNTPSPADFSDNQLTTICLHMEIRANLTFDEAQKIVEFMKSAN